LIKEYGQDLGSIISKNYDHLLKCLFVLHPNIAKLYKDVKKLTIDVKELADDMANKYSR
jgi:hypothetical protein